MLSLYVNPNMTFDATGFTNVNILGSNGTFAFDDEGGFIQGNNTVTFSGSVSQLITSTSLTNEVFYNLTISNTAGNVHLGVATTVSNQLTFTSGLLDATNYSLNLPAGNKAIAGASSAMYIITGNGIAGTGKLNISNLSPNVSTVLPIGTPTYYLPAFINPGANAGNGYSAFVFNGATTNAISNGPAFSTGLLSKILNAEWNVSQTAGSGSASLTLNWASAGTLLEGSAFQGFGLNIGIAQYTGGWQTGTGTGNIATKSATATFSSFSQFTVVGNGVILPDLLVDFDAHLANSNSVLLTWSVSDKANIRDFEVEKSTDRSHWKAIGTVLANDHHFPSATFSFTDTDPSSGENFYRLGIQNSDSRKTYSMIRSATLRSGIDMNVYPNPANNMVTVHVENKYCPYSVRLLGSEGRIFSVTENNSNSKIYLNIKDYPSGIYFLQIIPSKATPQTNILVIAHK